MVGLFRRIVVPHRAPSPTLDASVQRPALLVLLATLALTLAACGGSSNGEGAAGDDLGTLVTEGQLGPVSAELRMEPAAPRFGDRVRFTLDIAHEADAAVEEIDFGARLGHWRIRDERGPENTSPGHIRYQVDAEAERSGANIGRLPPIRFGVSAGEGAGTERALILETFEVEVSGLGPEEVPDLAGMAAPLAPLALPARTEGRFRLWLVVFGVLAVAIAAGAWWLWRSQRAPAGPPPIDPEAEAQAALEALLASGLRESGDLNRFYVELTGIVRRFIERTTGVHAPEQTTGEFLEEMRAGGLFAKPRQEALQDFLEAADLVKFAAQRPGAAEIEQAVAAARSFCRRATQEEAEA